MAEDENTDDPGPSRRGALGTALLVGGGAVLLAFAFEKIGGLPFGMPRSWYQFPALWLGLGIVAAIAGALLLLPGKGDEGDTT